VLYYLSGLLLDTHFERMVERKVLVFGGGLQGIIDKGFLPSTVSKAQKRLN
jgi:hypothetical protein